jgi:phosphoadenosine phosphosulfate reductase
MNPKEKWELEHKYRKSEHTCAWCKHCRAKEIELGKYVCSCAEKEKAGVGKSTKLGFDCDLWEHKEFEPMALQNNPAGYYVCISGGKDSSVIQELCIMAGVRCEFVHNHTSVDHPETVHFIKSEFERLGKVGAVCRIEYPRDSKGKIKTMWNMILKNGLPTRTQRWCCKELKEYGGIGRYCITGVRREESTNRKLNRGLHEDKGKTKGDTVILNNDNTMKRRLIESCIPRRKFVLNPIIDWDTADVWDFIKGKSMPYNPLYDMGFKRVGCIGCPLNHNRKKELEKFPEYNEAYFRAAERWINHRIERGAWPCGGYGRWRELF